MTHLFFSHDDDAKAMMKKIVTAISSVMNNVKGVLSHPSHVKILFLLLLYRSGLTI